MPNFTCYFGNNSTPHRPQVKHMNRSVEIKSTQLRKREISAHRHGLQALPGVRDSYITAQIAILYTYTHVMSQIETHTLTRWNLIGLSMTAPAPVLSPSSILPLLSSHYTFIPARRNATRLRRNIILSLL